MRTILIAVSLIAFSAATVDARPLPRPDRFYSERPPARPSMVEEITASIAIARENGDDKAVQQILQDARAANRAAQMKE